ncbi:MAG: hypothetical protein AMJ78_07620 [Omnitrophica WOR_2 bacterium SM23_29]|nr:MAG: hypothetical protein AMJ78_07620 [Omnitrophica WOR_2 bacterium SM23_29]
MQSNGDGQISNSSTGILSQVLKVGDLVEAEVMRITDFGAFVKFSNGKRGLIHISQISDSYVKNVSDHLRVGDKVRARIKTISPDGKIDLTLKEQREPQAPEGKTFKTSTFEEKLKQFLKESEKRQADLRKHLEEKRSKGRY